MICFTWSGLPYYGAKAIEAFVKVSSEPVCVFATRPKVPVKGIENVLSCKLTWVDSSDENVCLKLPKIPRIVFISNWNIPAWRKIEQLVRANGGSVVAMVDNNFQWSWRLLAKAIYYRLFRAGRFNAFFVPGESGRRLAHLYGVRSERVFKGFYGADADLFHDGMPLPQREKKIIYVGQLCERKNILPFCCAFERAVDEMSGNGSLSGWTLEIYGDGPLRRQLDDFALRFNAKHTMDRIVVNDFAQSAELSKLYRTARGFVLPSIEEHWGVVVHEAALSGCYLLLSKYVGATEDFGGKENAKIFNPFSISDMCNSIKSFFAMKDTDLIFAQSASVDLASHYSPRVFAESVTRIVRTVGSR